MRLSLALLSALAIPSVIAANIPVLSEYAEFLNLCKAAGPDAFATIRYTTGPPRVYKYGECLRMDDPDQGTAELVVVCRSAICYATRNPNCEPGDVLPVPVPLAPGLYAPATQIWVESLVGKSGSCKRLLPGLF